jgi:predicted N-acetyltransferase YhbS
MEARLRAGTPEDAAACGRICYEAFHGIATRHNFPPDMPDAELATMLIGWLLADEGFYSVVAERDGEVVGSNFLDERAVIAGVGPITVAPGTQDRGLGRRLMEDVLRRAAERGFAGVRLVQSAYHTRSLSLYAKLGFEIREPLAAVQGPPILREEPGYGVRSARPGDVEACAGLCLRLHGFDRAGELRSAVERGAAQVVEHDGRITGYTTGLGFFGHTVAESNAEVRALLGAAPELGPPGFLVPMRNGELLRWCLDRGLRVIQLLTLMSRGLYNEPAGAYLPSILF